MSTDSAYAKSIVLPCDEVFRNLNTAKQFAIDIGGSLAKIAYCSTVSKPAKRLSFSEGKDNLLRSLSTGSSSDVIVGSQTEGIRLHFIKFETKYIATCLEFIRRNISSDSSASDSPCASKVVKVTGGGAYKYYDLIAQQLGLIVDKEDEMECLIRGCNFLLRNIPDECFTFHHQEPVKYWFQNIDPCGIFPYLLVNIGSGVSIVKVESEKKFERVGGTAMGGGTFWGLGSLLTEAKGFDELLQLAERGDHRNVDMLVSDIFGGAYDRLGLPGDLIASSFGKTIRGKKDDSAEAKTFAEEDIARSLLLTVSNCIGQIAYLYAQQHNFKKIYFGGFFIRGHPITMRTISYAVSYWSKGEMQALFLRHEGYLGAVGAFMKGAEEDTRTNSYSWNEYYAGSSGFSIPAAFLSKANGALMDQLEMECAEKNLVHCPLLLNPAEYIADTVDLTQDKEAREYWLECFENGVEKTTKRAIASQAHLEDAQERARSFEHNYVKHLRLLRQQPFAYGCLNVRSLLDLNEQLLTEYYFPDAYLQQKRDENEHALSLLPNRLSFISTLEWSNKQMALVRGLLAGNVFDWGAREVVKLLETQEKFDFNDAEKKLQDRPWLCDGYDAWLQRLSPPAPPHHCAAIFVDNSGFDIVLGVIPFVIELLARGTNVILCANSRPALNDVTFEELTILMQRVAEMGGEGPKLVRDALEQRRLVVAENGQGSPCLDLNRIDVGLAELMRLMQTDLVVIVGMGRAIHTNFYTRFACESLKVAVIKNQWLARRLGGEMFSVIFKYETPSSQ